MKMDVLAPVLPPVSTFRPALLLPKRNAESLTGMTKFYRKREKERGVRKKHDIDQTASRFARKLSAGWNLTSSAFFFSSGGEQIKALLVTCVRFLGFQFVMINEIINTRLKIWSTWQCEPRCGWRGENIQTNTRTKKGTNK